MKELIPTIISLAEDKLSFAQEVVIQRQWLIQEGRAYIEVSQNRNFKFHLPCEPQESSLQETEKIVGDTLIEMGFQVSIYFSH